MPILIIYGIPSESKSQEQLEKLISDLQEVVAKVQGLGLTKKQITVFFPADLCAAGLGEEIICFCEGLFNKEERTREVRNRLANSILAVLMKHFPNTELVEVFVKKFHGDDGFASSQEEL